MSEPEDFLAGCCERVLFCDTDAFTAAVFHEVYLESPARDFDELVARRYDAYLVCGLDVPFAHDGIREFEERRRAMHERYVARARRSGAPWTVVEGPVPERVQAARVVVDTVL